MKKKFLLAIVVSIVFVLACYNIVTVQNEGLLSNLVLANVEALAGYESPDFEIVCGEDGGDCWVVSGICYYGPIIYDDCSFSGRMQDSCGTPCGAFD